MSIKFEPIRWILALVLLAFTVAAIYPFVYMFLLSLSQSRSLILRFDPDDISLINYQRIFINFNFFRYLINSIIVSGGAVLAVNIICSMAAYGFAKKRFPGKVLLFTIVMATLMIPRQVTLIPSFLIMMHMNLLNTYAALIIPAIGAFGIFMLHQFMHGVPDDLLEAAKIDGCGEVRIFVSIVLPLLKAALIALTVFVYLGTWNDFIWPLVTITDTNMQTLILALSLLQGLYATHYGLVMAGATLSFIPPFLLYVFLQKQFVQGVALSGIKG